jgi:predicted extracellular nuclease
MKNRPRVINLVLVFTLLFGAIGFISQPAQAAAGDLFFSEYVEGTSYNKALEIYNGTSAAVDLAGGGYKILMSFNGGTSTYTINLSGSVADGDVYVVAPTNATDATILAQADQLQGTSWFNGNDAVVLKKGETIIDVIGQIGFDPGSQWGTDLISTADNTLRRKESICQGDPIADDVFDPSIEWDGYATNTFDGLGSHTANCGGVVEPLEPVINEFSANTVGTDDVEFVEIYGDPETDYSAYKVLEIEGDGSVAGVIDGVLDLGSTNIDGFYLVSLSNGDLENGTLTLLLVKNFTAALGDDLDTNNDGVLDAEPWTAIVDSVGVNDGGTDDRNYGVPVLHKNYDGLSSFAPGGASRIPDGYDTDADTDWVRNDFDLGGIEGYLGSLVVGEAYNTPGAPNMVYTPPPEACGDDYTPIYEIQGSGMTTPLEWENHATEGIVVGDFQEGGKYGFFIQDPLGDGDIATSDGIFVYEPYGVDSIDVNVGDVVRVRGTAKEYDGLTEISLSNIWLCSDTQQSLPAPVELSLPVTAVEDFEPFEGMYVTFTQALVISEYYNFDRFGEIVLTSTRHLTPTAEFEPGSSEAYAAMEAYKRDSITLDDGIDYQNPDPARHPNGMDFTLDNLFRGGDLVTNVTGVMDYGNSLYRIQPTDGADYTPANARPEAPPIMEGDLKIASMNVLNYFTTLTSEGNICGPSGDMGCRGADDAEELERQRAKILAALSTMNADVVGLIEIENDRPGSDSDYAVADLVQGLNEMMGEGTYDYIATGAIGTDAIKVALIYKPAKVSPVGDFAILDSSVDPLFLDDYNRPVLAASFMDNWSEEVFTVAVNHLKSKGSACEGDPDLGDGAGNCNITRLAAAQAEVDWLAADPTGSGFDNTIIIGDLNSYDKEDPIDAIKAGPDDMLGTDDDYSDLLFDFQGEDAYSYVFDGQIGYLDYALSNVNFSQYIDDVVAWHINADEPDLIDYDTTYKKDAQDALFMSDAFRSSDHDPVIVTFTFDYDVVTVDILPESCENPFNVKAKGVLPVAILGTAELDVNQIDPESITLAGVSPVRWSYEDVATLGDCPSKKGDGYLDLVLHFDAQEIVTVLGEVYDGQIVTLKLIGYLFPEFGGTPVVGEDMVWIIKKGK